MYRLRTFRRIAALSLLSLLFVLPAQARKKQQAEGPQAPKYVFYMIGDGMGINEVYGAQNYNQVTGDGPEYINFTQFPVRTFVTTFSSSSLVTDSAAAGTALSSGYKTYNGAIGVDDDHKSRSNICNWAHDKGFGTGLATTVGVNHATPAAFFGHADHRSEYDKLASQLIEADFIDFAAGGGFLNEVKKTGRDSKYFEAKAREAGITVLHGREQFRGLDKLQGRVLCFSADPDATDLKYAIDRHNGETELSDFVRAGIDYLYGHFAEKGFFFMVEGGKIDSAGHGNDEAANIKELNDFAAAIDVVLDFCRKHPGECLILVTADHETGGLQLGDNYMMYPELLTVRKWGEGEINSRFAKLTEGAAAGNPPTWEAVKDFFREYLGLWGTIEVDEKQEAVFKDLYHKTFELNQDEQVESLYSITSRMVSDAIVYADFKAGYLWSHGGHTGSPVGLYVYGDTAAEFNTCTDNTQIPLFIKRIARY